jgi:hypothetical protein
MYMFVGLLLLLATDGLWGNVGVYPADMWPEEDEEEDEEESEESGAEEEDAAVKRGLLDEENVRISSGQQIN